MKNPKTRLLEDLSELFEVDVDELVDDYTFEEDMWDSLAVITAVSAIHRYYGTLIQATKLENCAKVADIFSVVAAEMEPAASVG